MGHLGSTQQGLELCLLQAAVSQVLKQCHRNRDLGWDFPNGFAMNHAPQGATSSRSIPVPSTEVTYLPILLPVPRIWLKVWVKLP